MVLLFNKPMSHCVYLALVYVLSKTSDPLARRMGGLLLKIDSVGKIYILINTSVRKYYSQLAKITQVN